MQKNRDYTAERNAERAAKVKAVNRAHQLAMEWHPKLVAVFQPLLGKQVVTGEGVLMAKIQKLLPQLPNTNRESLTRHSSVYSLGWNVKVCESTPHGIAVYYDVTIYVGELDGNTLKEIKPTTPTLRTDFTAEELAQKQKAVDDAKKSLSNAQSALWPFSERD